MMSADTHMNEMLLIATKRNERAESERRSEPCTITCVNLYHPPESVTAASWYAKWISDIDLSVRNSDVINEGGRAIGNWTRVASPKSGFPWFAVGMLNHHLGNRRPDGRSPGPESLEFQPHWRVVNVGPTHHLIGHIRGAGEEIGAFTFDEIAPDKLPTYPSLWSAERKAY